MRLRHSGVEVAERRPIAELFTEHDGALVGRQRLFWLAEVGQHDRKIHQATEMEGRVVRDAILAGRDDLAEQPQRFLVRVRARVRAGEHRVHADLLFFVLEKLGHPLGSLDERERCLRLSGHVEGRCQKAKPHELVRRAEALFERFEDRDRLRRALLLDIAACLEQLVLGGRGRCHAAKEIGRLDTKHAGDVLEGFHRGPRAARLEHRDVGLGVVRLRDLRLGHSLGRPQ